MGAVPACSIGKALPGSARARRHASISGSSGPYGSRFMGPISVAAHRGPFVESVHVVHAVAVQDGAVVAEAGNPAFPTSLRSSAKPFQALPLVPSRDDPDDQDIAIASASHRAQPGQIEAGKPVLADGPGPGEPLGLRPLEGRAPPPSLYQ